MNEDENIAKEHEAAIDSGTLVAFDDFVHLNTLIIIDGDKWDYDHQLSRQIMFTGSSFGIVISCTNESFCGRPAWRAHYLLTQLSIGWYIGNPTRLVDAFSDIQSVPIIVPYSLPIR